MERLKWAACGVVLLGAVFAAYSNSFHNDFHFDDAHTVQENPFIRDLRNIPRFFLDGTTFSSLPTNQSYRPLISTTLAVDYHLAHGLNPLWFHIDTFIWFVALLAAMFFLFRRVMDASEPDPNNPYIAMLAVAVFGLHPVCAETVNYIVQRGEIHSTLGVVLAMVMYIEWPRGRTTCLYLVPVIIGSLSKPPALMFLPIVFVYVYLFETEGTVVERGLRAGRASIPAMIVFIGMSALEWRMTPKTYTSGASSAYLYWLTQPGVILHYVKQFFLPTDLTADTDRELVSGILSENFVLSMAMIALILYAIRRVMRQRDMRAFTFGLCWFVIALAPTSLAPLAEVDNDHRMFFPFVGLSLAVVWGLSRIKLLARFPNVTAVAAALILAGCAWGTHQRNNVWHSEDSLWKDVSEKSPHNGRGLMNYGLTLMSKGDYEGALDLFTRAEAFTPEYATLKVNLGIVNGALDHDAAAEANFHEAIELTPDDAQCYYYYARYLHEKNKDDEAIPLLKKAVGMNHSYAEPLYQLMEIYSSRKDQAHLHEVAHETLQLFPGDETATKYLSGKP